MRLVNNQIPLVHKPRKILQNSSLMKKRYLLHFSYIGSHFKASAKITRNVDTTTVEGALEFALQSLLTTAGIQEVSPVAISSRTDVGVHALENTAHVDFIPSCRFSTENLITGINKLCKEKEVPLRVSKIDQVSNQFNARRFAKLRTYLYRIAIPKFGDYDCEGAHIPISEIDRCHFLRNRNYNINVLQEALSCFCGTHDFSSFTGKPTKMLAGRTPIRRIHSSYVCPGKPLMDSFYEPLSNNFYYWDLLVEGRSFTYRQVRRMVSVALAVAAGKLTVAGLQSLINVPRPFQPLGFHIVPAHGLYLLRVVYDEADLAVDRKRKPPNAEHLELAFLLDQFRLSLEN